MKKKLFHGLVVMATQYGRFTMIAALIMAMCSLWLASGIELKTSFKDLLGTEEPLAVKQTRLEEHFPSASAIQVVLEGTDEERLIEVAHAIEHHLLQMPEKIRGVILEEPVDFFMEKGLLYVPVEELQTMEVSFSQWKPMLSDLLRDPSTMGLFQLASTVLHAETKSTPSAAMLNTRLFGKVLLGDGPFGGLGLDTRVELDLSPVEQQMSRRTLEQMKSMRLPGSREKVGELLSNTETSLALIADVLDQGRGFPREEFEARFGELRELDYQRLGAPVNRYRISSDGTTLIMEIIAAENISAMDKAMPFLDWLKGEFQKISVENPDVQIKSTGLPVMLQEESEAMLNNFVLVTILGFIGILAVFIIGFERVGLPALAAIPLLFGVVWTFGVIGGTTGQLTLFALTFPVLLLGIGIDFAIHLISAFSAERAAGFDRTTALKQSYDKIGAGLLTGAFTTAGAFLVMLSSGLFGLRDMGFTAGIGVIMALIAMLTILPVMLLWWDKRHEKKGALLPNVPFEFMRGTADSVLRHRYWVLAGFLVLTVACAYQASTVSFDQNYMNIMPQGLDSMKAQDTILEKFGVSNEFAAFVVDDLEEARRIEVLGAESAIIGEVVSPAQLIPENQEAKRPYLESLHQQIQEIIPSKASPVRQYGPRELEELRTFVASMKTSILQASMMSSLLYDGEIGDQLGRVRDLINRVDGAILVGQAERFKYLDELIKEEIDRSTNLFLDMTSETQLNPEDLPESVLSRVQGDNGKWLVLVRAEGDVWEEENRKAFMGEIDKMGTEYSGLIPSEHRLIELILSEMPKMVFLITLLVFFLVLLDLRSFRGTLIAMSPLVVGMISTIGIMGVFDIPFNMVSVIAVPLIVGIGIDDGVHIYHRIRKERSLAPALMHSGKAVILTSMTTGIGFGSLMLSIHPGMYSLGMTTIIGICTCLLTSIFLLPALVAIFEEDLLVDPTSSESK